MNAFQVYILAADRDFYEGPCESIVVPTPDGYYGILARHSDMILAISSGMMTYRLPGGTDQIASVSSGLMKVENGEVMILVDTIEKPEEIDENRARRAADLAKEALLQERSIREYRAAQANLAREMGRLRVKSKSRAK